MSDREAPLARRGWRFTPAWVPTLATLAIAPLLLMLGFWQLERATFKAALIETMRERDGAAPVMLGAGNDAATRNLMSLLHSGAQDEWSFQPVVVTGRYTAQRQILLDNRTRAGQAGYDVLTPLALADGSGVILVDRGWLPVGAERSVLPDIAVRDGLVAHAGKLVLPPTPGLKLGDSGYQQGGWPRVVQWVDVEQARRALGVETLLPALMKLDRNASDGYQRSATARSFAVPPERHHGYAVQWFALAATLIALYLGLNLHRAGRTSDEL